MTDVTGGGAAQDPGPAIAGFQAGYVDVAGWPTWHEVGGDGPAVVLLHGGFSGAAAWSAQAPALIGQYYNSSGRLPDPTLEDWLRSEQAMDLLRQGYDPVSPDGPGHFPVVYAKAIAMIDAEPELDLATLAAVAVPILVLQGDRDVVTVEHSAAVAAALPDARLAVLPGTHALPLELPGVVNPLLISFLRGATSGSALQFLPGE